MDRRIVCNKAVASLCLIVLVGLAFLGCAVKTDQVSKWEEDGEVDPLIAALKDENYDVREAATQALGRIGKPAVEPLIVALRDEDWRTRCRAADALGEIGDARAVQPLIAAALQDRNRRVQEDATQALGKIGDVRTVELLITALKNENWDVREAAAVALGKIGWQPGDITERASYLIALGKLDEAGKLGAPGVEPLIVALRDEDWRTRCRAAEALGEIGDAMAVEPLIGALKDRNRRVQEDATQALGKIGKPAVAPLIVALRDEDWGVQKAAAEALGEIGDARAVEPLIAALKDKNWRGQEAAAEALGKIGEPAISPLNAVIDDAPCLQGSRIHKLVATNFLKGAIKKAEDCLVHLEGKIEKVTMLMPVDPYRGSAGPPQFSLQLSGYADKNFYADAATAVNYELALIEPIKGTGFANYSVNEKCTGWNVKVFCEQVGDNHYEITSLKRIGLR